MIGNMMSGTHANVPATRYKTMTNRIANNKSVAETTLPEVKKSRTESKSRN